MNAQSDEFRRIASAPPFEEGALAEDFAAAAGERPSLAAAKRFRNTLRETLYQGFRDDVPIETLVCGHALWADRLLQVLWKQHGLEAHPLSLIAVGGFGRGELFPGSDIDVLLLHDSTSLSMATEETISAFLMFLWDIGLEVGHAVRSIDECLSGAASDVTIATNLLEARYLCGDPERFERFLVARDQDPCWEPPRFFAAKLDEQTARHERFGETAYQLEPNVKEGPGGLRDIQMVGWISARRFRTSELGALVDAGFLRETERDELLQSLHFLWRVRFALHMLSGRREDRLLFDLQRAAANLFGFCDQNHNLAVEQFMQRYFRVISAVQTLNDILLQHFREEILTHSAHQPMRVHPRFQVRDRYLEAVNDQVFMIYPVALLEVFRILQQDPDIAGIRASTIRLIRAHRHLIDRHLRRNPTARDLMMQILSAPSGVLRVLRRMHRFGVLANYLPAFGRISGRMQYDLFHAYTVDEHTLNVLRFARRLAHPEYADEVPLAHERFQMIRRPVRLVLACLFHDIAKGRGGDHSELGAADARHFCLEHGLDEDDAELVAWLVRSHLVMSMTAQRKDISDPEVILGFAQDVGTLERLDFLYLLTVSDIRGTNPALWNSWKATLLETLYQATARTLERGLPMPPETDEQIGSVRDEARELLLAAGDFDAQIDALWSTFPKAYFVRHSADEIVWHSRAILEATAPNLHPVVLIRPQSLRGGTEIFLHTRDRRDLFARITTALSQLALNVVDARILTTRDGQTLDSFLVLDHDGRYVDPGFRSNEIRRQIEQMLEQSDDALPFYAPERPLPRRLKHFDVASEVHFEPGADPQTTRLHFTGLDRPGLLSRLGQLLAENNVRIRSARISTAGERVEDLFVVTDLAQQPLNHDQQRQLERLLAEL